MPIPEQQLRRFQQLSVSSIDTPPIALVEYGVPASLPNALRPGGWIICPGIHGTSPQGSELTDLDHRLRQAKLSSVPVLVRIESEEHEARFVQGMTRVRAVGFGYKLRHWAVFELTERGFFVVYTGHNSRSR